MLKNITWLLSGYTKLILLEGNIIAPADSNNTKENKNYCDITYQVYVTIFERIGKV
jgi:hypothetical protein